MNYQAWINIHYLQTEREMHRYTPEEVEFMKKNCKGRSIRELTVLINKRFSLSLSVEQIKGAMSNRGLTNGCDARFKTGHVPANKGVKGTHFSPETEFKPGHRPTNHRPVGSERVNIYGYIEIKISEPRTWALKHKVIWEAVNGPVPKGHVLIFSDGNKLNVSLDNLMLITRGELAVMNRNGLIYDDKNLTHTGRLIAALKIKISDRKRGNKCLD